MNSSYSIVPSRSPRPGMERIVDVDHQGRLLHAGQSRADLCGIFAVGDQHLGFAVFEDVGDRRRIEPGVDGVEHGAAHRHAVMRLQHRRHVRQHRRDRLSRAHAAARERRAEPPCPLQKLLVGEPQRAVDNCDALRMDRGGARQKGNRRQRRKIGRIRLQRGEQTPLAALRGRRTFCRGLGDRRSFDRHAAGFLRCTRFPLRWLAALGHRILLGILTQCYSAG